MSHPTPPDEIWIVYRRSVPAARKRDLHTTRASRLYWHSSPLDAWQDCVKHYGIGYIAADAAEFVIVPARRHSVDCDGTHRFTLDWARVVDPQGLPEVIAAERVKAVLS